MARLIGCTVLQSPGGGFVVCLVYEDLDGSTHIREPGEVLATRSAAAGCLSRVVTLLEPGISLKMLLAADKVLKLAADLERKKPDYGLDPLVVALDLAALPRDVAN